jgi:hypothetical protein
MEKYNPTNAPPQGSGTQPSHTMAGTNPPLPPHMPYLASLNIPNMCKLINEPILHDPSWPNMAIKLPSDIPKFEGKSGEDPANHITTFHLWCSSNNIMDDPVCLRLFQCTLTGPSTKWYVDEKLGSHVTFKSLAKTFLTFFKLPVHHDNGIKFLSECKKISTTHIADHIHEWCRRRSLCKAETTKEQCLNWFLRSLVSILAKYVASTFPQTEEEAIIKAQQKDLIYSQSFYLYTILPDAPRPVPFGQNKPAMSHMIDGLIGTTTHHNLNIQTPPMYSTPQYPSIYGGPFYYPPPPYQHPYNMGTSESTMPSYAPYGSLPQNNPYFPFLVPPQPIAPPQGQPHVGFNFVQPSPIQQFQNFEQLNTENLAHQPNNAKNKGKNCNNNNPGQGGNNPQQNQPPGGNQNQGN